MRNLAHIIEARMSEVVELVHAEVITSGFANKLAGGIVITGGGSQLGNLKQLVEYMTGMDVRIGHPNEHLGKCKVEEVKSPMYATSVGLVLSGFRAIDERENRYNEALEVADGQSVASRFADKGGSFFQNILNKTKGLLIDDFEEKGY